MDRAISVISLIIVVFVLVTNPLRYQSDVATTGSSNVQLSVDISREIIRSVLDSPEFEDKLATMVSMVSPNYHNSSPRSDIATSPPVQSDQSVSDDVRASVNNLVLSQLDNNDALNLVKSDLEELKTDLVNLSTNDDYKDRIKRLQQGYLTGSDQIPGGMIMMFFGHPEYIPKGWTYCTGDNGLPDPKMGKLAFKADYSNEFFVALCKKKNIYAKAVNVLDFRQYKLYDSTLQKLYIQLLQKFDFLYSMPTNEKQSISTTWEDLIRKTNHTLNRAIVSNDRVQIKQAAADYDIVHRAYFGLFWNSVQK